MFLVEQPKPITTAAVRFSSFSQSLTRSPRCEIQLQCFVTLASKRLLDLIIIRLAGAVQRHLHWPQRIGS